MNDRFNFQWKEDEDHPGQWIPVNQPPENRKPDPPRKSGIRPWMILLIILIIMSSVLLTTIAVRKSFSTEEKKEAETPTVATTRQAKEEEEQEELEEQEKKEEKKKKEEQQKKEEQEKKKKEKNAKAAEVHLEITAPNPNEVQPFCRIKFGMYPQIQVNRSGETYRVLSRMRANSNNVISYKGNKYKRFKGNFYKYEPITWYVFERKGDIAYLVSEKILSNKPYHDKFQNVVWQRCSLRKWLNDYFYYKAFGKKERDVIRVSKVANTSNPIYGTTAGEDTRDCVYLLGMRELEKDAYCLNTVELRQTECTDFAIANGAYTEKATGKQGRWWLRTPGDERSVVANVLIRGGIYDQGSNVNILTYGVRPVIQIDLTKLK